MIVAQLKSLTLLSHLAEELHRDERGDVKQFIVCVARSLPFKRDAFDRREGPGLCGSRHCVRGGGELFLGKLEENEFEIVLSAEKSRLQGSRESGRSALTHTPPHGCNKLN